MKKVVAFLLAFLIFTLPITTLVKADVVIGDNDSLIVDENGLIIGRKLALLESFSDLALSGVSEFSISNANNVDDYLDSLWGEVNDAIESLQDGSGFTDISNELKSKYFTNLVQYKDYINSRGDYLAQLLPTGNPTTSFLSTYFADNVIGKRYTQYTGTSLNAFRALSRRGNNITPSPDPDYQTLIDRINLRNSNNPYQFWFYNYATEYYNPNQGETLKSYYTPWTNYTWARRNASNGTGEFDKFATPNMMASDIIDIYITSNNGVYSWDYYFTSLPHVCIGKEHGYQYGCIWLDKRSGTECVYGDWYGTTQSFHYSYSGTLGEVLFYISENIKNANIYVDGVPWSIVGSSNPPTLDIDGIIKIYGNDYPSTYELQPNTQIDYEQLYQVIYNAIRDNLPISKDDITYYDSHDNIYSPTIINNYGDEDGQESDLIDTILDYAVIPSFDTAIAQPMRGALTNGVLIMQTSITNVIPDEILLILGACFFLLLFAVVINRMIK